jgi:hypothetical protein
MTPIEENACLENDLDCRGFSLKNVLHFYPVPGNLVQLTDPRLSDPRPVPAGSVTNESVADQAAIVQSKLNLNGVIPPAWFTPSPPDIDAPAPVYPARGDQAEMIARKGVLNGYAAIDSNRRLLPANVSPGAGLGTVGDVRFSFPAQFNVVQLSGATINCSVTWVNAPNNSWFGINGHEPQFFTDQLPMEIIPGFSATRFTTGLFDPELFPVAKYGPDHAPGFVPDPGENGDKRQYLGRDMNYHHFTADQPYQPFVPAPVISVLSIAGDRVTINISCSMAGSLLFYRIRTDFIEGTNPQVIQVLPGTYIEAYAAREGYNNSEISSYTAPIPAPPQDNTSNLTEVPDYGN